MKAVYHYSSPLGSIVIESDGQVLTGLRFGEPDDTQRETAMSELPIFSRTALWLDIYFSGKAPDFTPPMKIITTPFRKEVYDILMTIPYGRTMTYGEAAYIIAKKKGIDRMSAQAVGGAVGRNPIGLIIPCHRVVGANGKLVGYAAGLDKKAALLKLEGINLHSLY